MVVAWRAEMKHTVAPTPQCVYPGEIRLNEYEDKFTKSSQRESLDSSPLSWGSLVRRQELGF